MSIPLITFNNGVTIPQLGLGTWQMQGEDCINAVRDALALGYRHIDTAKVYGNESEIGKVISDFPREQLFITSKAWPQELTGKQLLEECNESLARLGTTYLDLYLIHWPNKSLDYKDIFTAFKQLYEEKKVRAVGISNFTTNHIKELLPLFTELDLPIVTNQIEYHPFLNQNKLLAYCEEHDMKVTAYSPLARGEVFESEKLRAIAQKYSKTVGQITLRWLIQKGMIVIPKASSHKHMKENMEVFDFILDEEDFTQIEELNKDERLVNPAFSEFDY